LREHEMESIYKLPLILTPQQEGGFTVTCPVLPELVTEGETARETLDNATDALAAIIEAYEDLNRPMPPVLRQASTEAPIWFETALVL
jgi:antitoxin HicB